MIDVTDEDWKRALDCAHSCLPTVARAELDNAMQHAFGILSLARINAPQAAQCTCAQAGFPESCDNCDGAHAQRIRNMALDEAAIIAENGCDGGEPTEAERELCESIALQIRQFKREGAQTRHE